MPIFFDFPNEWIAFLVFFAIIMTFIGLAELARNVLKLSPELSRKFVHVMVGILVSLAPFFLETKLPVLVLGVLFTVLNYVALKKDSLKGMHTTERISFGTVYFPIAFTLLVVMFWDRNLVIFILSMLILAFSDTAATIVGERINSKNSFTLWHDQKSWPGSITFFITTIIVVLAAYPIYAGLAGYQPLPLIHVLGLAVFTGSVTSVAEAVSKQGSDNLTLTLAAGLALDLYLHNLAQGTLLALGGWFAISVLLGYGAYKLRSLSVSGGFGAFLLGVFMFGIGSWSTMLPLIGFFVLSSILSKIADRKNKPDIIATKGSQRDIVQVYANGGIPLLFSIAWYLSDFSFDWLYWAFLASLASATADTWETEIGSFSKGLPLNIISWKRVPKGYSGGISLVGTVGGLFGAAAIVAIAYSINTIELSMDLFIMIILSGFMGSVVDSILGARIQAKFICSKCDEPTERLIHCGHQTIPVSGVKWFSNDWVNVAGTLSGGGIFLLFYFIWV
ncbi:MAG: DUF92 domain-containing protein [Candidatus Marinimicrobia bacterium]|nr:DUF92 domain-containing protein [Candidatus Neomarinimicrobiota bacterium]